MIVGYCLFGGFYLYDHVISLLQLIDVVDYINWFLTVELELDSWDKFHLVMMYNNFYTLLGSICKYFAQNLCIVDESYWFIVFFLLKYLHLALVLEWCWPDKKVRKYFFCFSYLRLWWIGEILSSNINRIHQ